MRNPLILSIFVVWLNICQAQTAVPKPAEPASGNSRSTAAAAIETRTERLQVEDAGSLITELRVGGETRSITVQPKGGMPSYQVQPGTGERSWKIGSF